MRLYIPYACISRHGSVFAGKPHETPHSLEDIHQREKQSIAIERLFG